MNKIIDGKQIATDILNDLHENIKEIGIDKIGLAVILVGKNPASEIYISMKKKACEKIGIKSFIYKLEEKADQKTVLNLIHKLNGDKNIHGILVQMPLPPHIDEKEIIYAINPNKDVDGFHPINMGKMLLGEEDCFYPCTPLGIKVLLEKANIEVERKHVVIVGRSNIVGKPLAAILVQDKQGCNATVTIAHSKTQNLKFLTTNADILISAAGSFHLIKKDMVKENSVVIDVGINRINNKIYGDVDFDNILSKVAKITPVPKGVGPMTIAMLLKNCYLSYLKKI